MGAALKHWNDEDRGHHEDLSGLARVSFWALVALIMFGVVMIFVDIPGGSLTYSVLGLAIFTGPATSDFQRLRIFSRNSE